MDHLGSVIAKTNETGAVTRQMRYRAYGDPRGHWTGAGTSAAPADNDRHEWTGYEREHDAGLDYAGARFYDPAIGQFLSHDPQRQYASPYAYGPGDPINGTDPDGRFFWAFVAQFVASIAFSAIGFALDSTGHANVSTSPGTIRFGGTGSLGGGRSTSPFPAGPVTGTKGAERSNPAAAQRNARVTERVESNDPAAVRVAKQNSEAATGDWSQGQWQGDLPGYNALLDAISGSPPNDDGVLTLAEANYHYRHGNGEPLTVDLGGVDLSNLSESDFGGVGSSRYLSPAYPDRLVYGNIRLTLGPGRTVTSRFDVYDFDIQSFQGSWLSSSGLAQNARTFGRNVLTVFGSAVAGSGTPYRINFTGVGRLGGQP